MKCPNCHADNLDTSRFCGGCGVPLDLADDGIGPETRTLRPRDKALRTHDSDLIPGTMIADKYKLLDMLGQGGMGVVFRAEQIDPIRREVALKIIKLGMDTNQIVARFEAERQALAVMDHPNIARVFDAGVTEAGQPFFVMEFVRGAPIDEYCDHNRLMIQERLGLVAAVCRAVQHAHQKGVIHRDLKPSNILVELQDGCHVPKVIDFGIARATNSQLIERSFATEQGQFVGTPEYMSPEQAEVSGLDVDTRTDIYSLGVILYQLLVGALPIDSKSLRAGGYGDIGRIIRDTNPLRPSTRIDSLEEEGIAAAKNRKIDPASLRKMLKGDLDWIIMKAMEKDRSRRYATASELVADIERYFRHEPVSASPPSTFYRIGKYVKRHKWGVAAAAATMLAVLMGIVGTTAGLIRAVHAEKKAVEEAAAARGVSDFLVGLFKVSDPSESRGNSVTAREILDKGAKDIDEALKSQPAIQSRLMATIGEVFTNLGLYKQAEPLLKNALETQRRVLGNDNLETLKTIHQLANMYWFLNRVEDAESLYLEYAEANGRLLGKEHPETLKAAWEMASLYHSQGRYSDAETLARRTLEAQRRVLGSEHPDTIASMHNLASILWSTHRLQEALPLNEEAVELRRRTLGEDHPNTLESMYNLATTYEQLNDYDRAEPIYLRAIELSRRVLGDQHPYTTERMGRLATMYLAQERFDKAEELLKQRLTIMAKAPEPNPQGLIAAHRQLAGIYRDVLGNPTEADAYFRKMIEVSESAFGKEDPRIIPGLSVLAGLWAMQGRFEKADPVLRRILAIREKTLPPNPLEVARARLSLATNCSAQGQLEIAKSLYVPSIKTLGESPQVNKAEISIAQARYWAALKQPERALSYLKQAVELGYSGSVYADPYLASLSDRPGFGNICADVLNHLNLDFEQYSEDGKPKAWNTGQKSFDFGIDKNEAHAGKVSLRIEKTGPNQIAGQVWLSFSIEFARGKTLRLSAFVKTENVIDGSAGLSAVVLGPGNAIPAGSDLADQGPKGTTTWHEYAIELVIPKSGTSMRIGLSLSGSGRVWFDDLRITVDGESH
jgi:serine/threonine protein kinase/tetratricopeptide (TPR) repeat protein